MNTVKIKRVISHRFVYEVTGERGKMKQHNYINFIVTDSPIFVFTYPLFNNHGSPVVHNILNIYKLKYNLKYCFTTAIYWNRNQGTLEPITVMLVRLYCEKWRIM